MIDAVLSVPDVAIFKVETGALVLIGPTGTIARDGQSWVPLPTGYSDETHSWSTSARMMVENAAKVEARLIADIKATAEAKKMALLSSGGAKKAEYAEKRQEVISYDTLASGVGGIVATLTSITTPRRAVMFAHATADAAAHGDTIGAAIERFRAGIAKSANTPAIAAAESAACDAIRAAGTIAAKRAAAAAVKWPS